MNRVSARCPLCGTAYRVEERLLGKRARCVQCRGRFRLAPAGPDPVSSAPWPWLAHLPRTVAPGRPASESDAEGWRPGDLVLGLYEILEVFTSGGMGLVYRARHRGWEVEAAIKRPRPEFFQAEQDKDNFEREAETWVKLGPHPHAVTCYYVRRLGGIPHVFAEFVSGGSLADAIRDGRLDQGDARTCLERRLDLAIQMAWGLEHAHREGLVHRDVKPGNVLLTEAGVAKVTDFGMARALGGTALGVGDTLVSSGGLTPAFCSPEQFLGEPITRGTDVWSWGLSVLEMFTGPASWSYGYLAPDILSEYLRRPPPPGLPSLPPRIADLLRRCFRRSPNTRPISMADVADILIESYKEIFKVSYPRRRPPPADAFPEALNNRAVSLLDLNKEAEAIALWERALAASPAHPEATYNLALYLWRHGRLSEADLKVRLSEACASHPGNWLPNFLLGTVHMELGDWQSAAKVLSDLPTEAAPREEVRLARSLASSRAASPARCLRLYEGHEDWVSSVSLSADGALALSGSADRTLRVWEVASMRCRRVLEGHADWVTATALSSDGSLALSGSADGTIRLWHTESGETLRSLVTGAWVLGVALSPDGGFALAMGGDGLVGYWDLEQGQKQRTLQGHKGPVLSGVLAPNGRIGLTGGGDGTVRLWDLKTGVCQKTLLGHQGKVHAVAFIPESSQILSAGADRTLRLWEPEEGRCLRILQGHSGPVLSACVTAEGTHALTGSGDRTVRVWRLQPGHCVALFEGHSAAVGALAVDASGRQAISGSGDHTLMLWRLPSDILAPYRMARVLPGEEAVAGWADFEKTLADAWQALGAGQAVAAAGLLRAARSRPGCNRQPDALDRWTALYIHLPKKALSGSWERTTLEGHHGAVTALAVSSDGRRVLSGGADGSARVWEVASGQTLRNLDAYGTVVTSLALSPREEYTAWGGADGFVRIMETNHGEVRGFAAHSDIVTGLAFHPDRRRLLTSGSDGELRLWEVRAGRCLRALSGRDGPIHTAGLSPDGRHAVAGSGTFLIGSGGERLFTSGSLRLWDLETGRCVHDFGGHPEVVTTLAISADGTRVLTGGNLAQSDGRTGKLRPGMGRLTLWDLTSGAALGSWEGHLLGVTGVALTADGQFAMSAGLDGLVRVWETPSGQCLRSFIGHTGAVTSLALTADSRHAVSGGTDRTVRVWLLDWDLEDREPQDWDSRAETLLEMFLAARTPLGRWTEDDFEGLLYQLGCAGFGWLRPLGIRKRLEQMARDE